MNIFKVGPEGKTLVRRAHPPVILELNRGEVAPHCQCHLHYVITVTSDPLLALPDVVWPATAPNVKMGRDVGQIYFKFTFTKVKYSADWSLDSRPHYTLRAQFTLTRALRAGAACVSTWLGESPVFRSRARTARCSTRSSSNRA